MAYIFKFWKEGVYELRRSEHKTFTPRVEVTYVPIDFENAHKVTSLRGKTYERQFRAQLKMGDFGYYACVDGEVVGYGWYKTRGSKDYFFKVSDGCCYLCRFFVSEKMRGNGIYPALISKLIETKADDDLFYLAIEDTNISSQKGSAKVGFKLVCEYVFLRILKYTFNKKELPPKKS